MSLDKYCGKVYVWKENSKYFDAYMKHVGVSYYVRQLAKVMPNSVTLEKHGGEYSITNRTPINVNNTLRFVPGKTFEHTTQDGRKVQSTVTVEKNVVHEIQRQKNGLVEYIDRVFTEDQLILNCRSGHMKGKMFYVSNAGHSEIST